MDICEIEKYLKLVFGISVVLQRSLIFWREWICFTNVLIVSGNGIVSRLTACMMCTEASLDPMCTISTVSYGNGWVNSSWQTRATISPIHVYARNTFFVLFVYLERTFKWQSCQRFSLIKHVKFSVWLNLGTCHYEWSVGFCMLIVQDIWRT